MSNKFDKEIWAAKRELREGNKQYSKTLVPIPRLKWPVEHHRNSNANKPRIAVWRSCEFLAQAFEESPTLIRLSICRTEIDSQGHWKSNITWDELQNIKNQVGYEKYDAVELFPAAKDVVNVSNMRHLWIDLLQPSPLVWRRNGA